MTESILEFVALLQSVLGDAQGGSLGLVGILTLVAKYSVDVLRSRLVQSLLPSSLQWAQWGDAARMWVGLGQSFLLALIPALAVMSWPAALVAALTAAFGAKGLHDSALAPGKRPTPPPPSLGRAHSIRSRMPGA